MTDRNIDLIKALRVWLKDLEEHIKDDNTVLFLHLDVNSLSGEMITNIKVASDDRELQRPKQKTA